MRARSGRRRTARPPAPRSCGTPPEKTKERTSARGETRGGRYARPERDASAAASGTAVHAGDDSAGSVKPITSPPPGRASAKTSPPCRSAVRRTAASPMPEPRAFVENAGSKSRSAAPSGAPGPSSAHAKRTPAAPPESAAFEAERTTAPPRSASASAALTRKFVSASRRSSRSAASGPEIGRRVDRDGQALVRPEVGRDLLEERAHRRRVESPALQRRRVSEPAEPPDALGEDRDLSQDVRGDLRERARRRGPGTLLEPPHSLGREADRRERVLDVVRDRARGVHPRGEAVGARELGEVLEEQDRPPLLEVLRQRHDRDPEEALARRTRAPRRASRRATDARRPRRAPRGAAPTRGRRAARQGRSPGAPGPPPRSRAGPPRPCAGRGGRPP